MKTKERGVPDSGSPALVFHRVFPRLFSLRHAVSDADFGEDVLGLGGVFLNLPPDIRHVHPENLIVIPGPGPPQLPDNIIISQNLPGEFSQQRHNAELVQPAGGGGFRPLS